MERGSAMTRAFRSRISLLRGPGMSVLSSIVLVVAMARELTWLTRHRPPGSERLRSVAGRRPRSPQYWDQYEGSLPSLPRSLLARRSPGNGTGRTTRLDLPMVLSDRTIRRL